MCNGSVIGRRTLGVLAATGLLHPIPATATSVELRSSDGLRVLGDHLAATTARRCGTILLFHMAGSNRGEYATIAPELARRGFDTLATDQRSGGAGWGRRNETAAALPRDPGFRAALPDLEAAMAWARQRDASGPFLIWGSSYSAALVFLLAAASGPAVPALLGFSPREFLPGVSVHSAASRVNCPVFVTSDADPGEAAAAAALLAAVPGAPKRQFRPRDGTHGSSILRDDRNPRGAASAWATVVGLLDEVAPA